MHKGRDELISLEEAKEGIEIVSKICGVDKEKINYPTVECNGPSISEYKFDYFPPSLLHTDFKYEIQFINCKFGSWENFDLYNTSKNFLVFINCEFDYICLNNDLVTDNTFELNNKLYFFGCKFNGDIDIGKANINGEIKFSGCIFKDVFSFDVKEYLANIKIKNCISYKLFFMSGSFKNNVYFNNSHFKDYVDFHECEFEKTACFYGVTFDKAPNFSQVIFKGNLNAVNTNLNFTFDDLQEKIKQEYEDFNKGKNKQDKKSLDKFANDFRDSFRTFKSALIKDNNALNASNFHKYELYCKEIELKEKKPKMFSKEWMDKWQLFFYRKLCDHHTDLLLNLKWLVYIIALYVLFLGKIPIVYPACIIVLIVCMYCKKTKNIQLILSFIIIFITICFNPKLIFGVSNLFSDSLNWWQNLITAIYMVILGLVLFSLQKTARKNSIVPS